MLNKLIPIVRRAGKIILSADLNNTDLRIKSTPGNFVTRYDWAVQNMLYDELKKILPGAEFVGEESDQINSSGSGYCFIVDPIDGTTNLAWDYHHSAVSVGLAHNQKMVIGLVYNPYLDELFYAEAGKGAYLNNKRIYASNRRLKKGLVSFGSSPYDKTRADETFSLVKVLYQNSLDIRRSGAAALDICYIACGRCELFFEMDLSPWDYAAASLIVNEAGGIITDLKGESIQFRHRTSILAGGSQAYQDFWNIL